MAQKSTKESSSTGESSFNRIAIKNGHLRDVHQKIRILNFKSLIDNTPTHIDESSSTVLKYKTPNFR